MLGLKSKRITDALGEVIFSIRWPLAFIYVLLYVPVISYCVWFAQEVFSFWVALYDDPPHQFGVGPFHIHIMHHNAEDFILWTLGLIDASMVANLLVMITIGGYSTFVKEFDFESLKGKPRWMNRLDSSTLKIKMSQSLISITSILILKTSMEYNTEIREMLAEYFTARHQHLPYVFESAPLFLMGFNLIGQIIVHAVFIATAFGFTWVAKLMHGHTPHSSDTNSHNDAAQPDLPHGTGSAAH